MEVDGQHVCLFVDSLVGKQEIVVKPIPSYVKKVKGLSGCTQLGDGSIALILDGAGLIDQEGKDIYGRERYTKRKICNLQIWK